MITMKKEYCILCNGSGWVNPYPYRKREKCDHSWNRGSFMDRYNTAKEKVTEAQKELEALQLALENEVKDNK